MKWKEIIEIIGAIIEMVTGIWFAKKAIQKKKDKKFKGDK